MPLPWSISSRPSINIAILIMLGMLSACNSPVDPRGLENQATESPAFTLAPLATWTTEPTSFIVINTKELSETASHSPTSMTITSTLPPYVSCIPESPDVTFGKVLWISSGDTIVVDIEGKQRTVHYLGVFSESVRPNVGLFGPPAATQNAALVEGQIVKMVPDGPDVDNLGRLERYVVINNTEIFVNFELIRQGLTKFQGNDLPIACAELLELAQQSAEQDQLGLWGPVPALIPTVTRPPISTVISTPVPIMTLTQTNIPATPSASATSTMTPTSGTATLTASPTRTSTHTQTLDPLFTPQPSPTSTYTPPATIFCDRSYPEVCIPQPPPDLDCEDIAYVNFIANFPDPHGFDTNGDQIGCGPGDE